MDNEVEMHHNTSKDYQGIEYYEEETFNTTISFEVEKQLIMFLKSNRYNFGVTFPCSKLKNLFPLLENEKIIDVIPVTKEEEGIGICAGAFLAGKKPFMLIQSSGLGNSFNAIASLLKTYMIPLLILASYRGYNKEKIPAQIPLGKAIPGMLDALEIPFIIVRKNFERVQKFTNKNYKNKIPHVVLISPEMFENEQIRSY